MHFFEMTNKYSNCTSINRKFKYNSNKKVKDFMYNLMFSTGKMDFYQNLIYIGHKYGRL